MKKIDTKDTWLLQRLQKPLVDEGKIDAVAAAFCFGGGGSGLSEEAWALISHIFHFEYMGAAEYEFGAAAKCLHAMGARAEEMEILLVEVPRSKLGLSRRRKYPTPQGVELPPEPTEPLTFYVVGPADIEKYAEALILNLASDKQRLKEGARFTSAVDPIGEYDSTVGWLDFNKNFMITVDKIMAEKFYKLFRPT